MNRHIDVASQEQRVEIGLLLDLYGNILTEKQRSAMDMYFQQDYSLSEIAENYNITRQAVRDSLLRAEAALYSTEEKLGLFKKFSSMKDALTKSYENASYVKDYAQRKLLPSDIIAALNDTMQQVTEVLDEDNHGI